MFALLRRLARIGGGLRDLLEHHAVSVSHNGGCLVRHRHRRTCSRLPSTRAWRTTSSRAFDRRRHLQARSRWRIHPFRETAPGSTRCLRPSAPQRASRRRGLRPRRGRRRSAPAGSRARRNAVEVIGGEALDAVARRHVPQARTPKRHRVDQRLAKDDLLARRQRFHVPHAAVRARQVQMQGCRPAADPGVIFRPYISVTRPSSAITGTTKDPVRCSWPLARKIPHALQPRAQLRSRARDPSTAAGRRAFGSQIRAGSARSSSAFCSPALGQVRQRLRALLQRRMVEARHVPEAAPRRRRCARRSPAASSSCSSSAPRPAAARAAWARSAPPATDCPSAEAPQPCGS